MTLESFLSGQNLSSFPRRAPNVLRKAKATAIEKPKRPPRGENKPRVIYAADFETTIDVNDCRVWHWGLAPIENPMYDNVEWDISIDSFMDRISQHNATCYFHNLKFDGFFILDWLMKNGYKHVQTDLVKRAGTFKTLISDMGQFYSITVKWDNGHTCEFRDSLKKLPMTVARIAKSFNLDQPKGSIDYKKDRPVGYQPTDEEIDYLKVDVSTVAQALKIEYESGMKRLTVASDSMAEYKSLIGPEQFKRLFPVLSEKMDSEIRRAYRGGFTYADPRFKSKITRSGLVLDVNSLYPSVMMNNILPYGEPKWVDGEVKANKQFPLVIFSVTFTAKLKKNHIPCIQIKGTSIFSSTEYLKVIEEPVTLMVTNVDWELYNDHYDIDVIEYGGGWAFHAAKGMFDIYIKKWSEIKANSTGGLREIAKLHLNALYGKFASNPNVTGKIPKLIDNKIKLVRGLEETRPPVYTAVGVFITAFARDLTIRAAQVNYKTFAYADTDSLHLLTTKVPTEIEVHPTKLGAWKLEYYFSEAFFIRPKAYIEKQKDTGEFTVHIAGLPEVVTKELTFDDLVDGKVFVGKLSPKVVPGGVVLEDIPFKLKL